MNSGLLVLVGVLSLVTLWFLSKARSMGSRSGWNGSVAVAIGIAAFIPAVLGPAFEDPDQRPVVLGCGIATLVLAVACLLMAIRTTLIRRRDHGVSLKYPVAALLLGSANLFCGAGIVASGSGRLAPESGTEWTWRSEAHGFEVTIPSLSWTLTPSPKPLAFFTCPRPHLMGTVAETLPAATEAEWETSMALARKIAGDTSMTDVAERTGSNRHGNPHLALMGEGTSEKGPYYFGVSVTRVNGKAVLMMFEGQYQFNAKVTKAQEARAFRTQADLFLTSVK